MLKDYFFQDHYQKLKENNFSSNKLSDSIRELIPFTLCNLPTNIKLIF